MSADVARGAFDGYAIQMHDELYLGKIVGAILTGSGFKKRKIDH